LQLENNIELERVARGFQFVDGMAWSRGGFLVIADVRQNKLFRIDSTPRPKSLVENNGGASGLAYDIQGRLYICESVTRRLSRMDRQGAIEEFAGTYQGKKFNAPNDVVVRRDGQVYFTDPAFGSAADHRDLDFYGIWHVTPKGDIEPVAKWTTRPNGIALSADGKLLFVADSDRHAVAAFDLRNDGAAGSQRDVVTDIAGVPGGIRTDVEGRIYVAARGLGIYSAAGKLERTLVQGYNTINCTFGEVDSEHLYISTRNEIYRANMGVKGAFQY
jgi:gluconolactonase